MRSSNRLPLELPDLSLIPLEKEGLRGDAMCIVAQMDHGNLSPFSSFQIGLELANIFIGKTNLHGRIEYGAALRHRDYKSCLVGAIAIYFFGASSTLESSSFVFERAPTGMGLRS
jgi:hypothetical protein